MSEKRSMKLRGEDAAAAYLERVGICVSERRYECEAGRVDIVGFDGDTVVFVDVVTGRATSKMGGFTQAKMRRLRRIADAYVEQCDLQSHEVRFDAVSILVIAPDRALLRHHRAVF